VLEIYIYTRIGVGRKDGTVLKTVSPTFQKGLRNVRENGGEGFSGRQI